MELLGINGKKGGGLVWGPAIATMKAGSRFRAASIPPSIFDQLTLLPRCASITWPPCGVSTAAKQTIPSPDKSVQKWVSN